MRRMLIIFLVLAGIVLVLKLAGCYPFRSVQEPWVYLRDALEAVVLVSIAWLIDNWLSRLAKTPRDGKT